MSILVGILTLIFMIFYGRFVAGLYDDGHYLWLLALFIAPFIWARYVSTEWEKEHDAANFRAWKQKWRCRFSRLWPVSGEVLPKEHAELPPSRQGDVRKLPRSS